MRTSRPGWSRRSRRSPTYAPTPSTGTWREPSAATASNTALRHFDLDPYQPRYQVPVTVSATVHITADDADAAQRRVRYLIDGLSYSGDNDEDEVEVTLDDTQVGDPETP